jgi:TolB protein
MRAVFLIIAFFVTLFLVACNQKNTPAGGSMTFEGEKHLSNLKMLTDEGENAEAYFSFDQSHLIYQSRHGSYQCDQIFMMALDGGEKRLLSTGFGKTTCSYFYPDNLHFLYASTHGASHDCPPPPDYSHGYVWKVYASYELYIASLDDLTPKLLNPAPGYDAEATISPTGDRIVFTSQRNGDLDIYSMNLDGSDLKQLTHELGYDGGPFYSWDGTRIVYRSYHPKSIEEVTRYEDLLRKELIEPGNFQLWIMNADGSGKHLITHNNYANFAPFFHPDDKRIIFCSNIGSTDDRNPVFNLWMINDDGTGLEQITFFNEFDGFPMFTKDGKKLVFASNRFDKKPHETNIFIADWIE